MVNVFYCVVMVDYGIIEGFKTREEAERWFDLNPEYKDSNDVFIQEVKVVHD